MKESLLLEKSYQFALRVVKLCRYLNDEQKEFVISRQILQSGTAIGSQIEESAQSQSTPDFLHHLTVANKKAFDTNYWLRLLRDSGYVSEKQAASIIANCEELQKMLIASIKTTKSKIGDK